MECPIERALGALSEAAVEYLASAPARGNSIDHREQIASAFARGNHADSQDTTGRVSIVADITVALGPVYQGGYETSSYHTTGKTKRAR